MSINVILTIFHIHILHSLITKIWTSFAAFISFHVHHLHLQTISDTSQKTEANLQLWVKCRKHTESLQKHRELQQTSQHKCN